ncbi:DUF810 domain-containing protein [Paenibacillus alkaliterrae]|nr:DUF810 domain-containing protein [Paenibacillus alkaliterrae]MCF2940908.1 DUF810 domain-containing protein [Paenibacillus alkaliterrae]
MARVEPLSVSEPFAAFRVEFALTEETVSLKVPLPPDETEV